MNHDTWRHGKRWSSHKKHLGVSPTDIEATLREAKLAFKNYPDIEAAFVRQIVDSMRARGESSAADVEESQFAQKVGPDRVDLNIDHAAETIDKSMATDGTEQQIRTYYLVLKTYGNGAGMEFFSRVVQPFAEHIRLDHPLEAYHVARAAQGVLHIEPDSQLDQDMQALLARLKPGN